jgi:hypothetical protein
MTSVHTAVLLAATAPFSDLLWREAPRAGEERPHRTPAGSDRPGEPGGVERLRSPDPRTTS